jgi:hypothetical protein
MDASRRCVAQSGTPAEPNSIPAGRTTAASRANVGAAPLEVVMRVLTPLLVPLFFLPACTSYMQDTTPTGAPAANEAKVVFCRPSRFVGNGIEYPLWDGDRLVGFAEHGCTVEYFCAPGEHRFVTLAQSYKCVPATLTAGHTYYLWVTPRFGVWTSAVGLTAVRKEDAELIAELTASLADTTYRAPVAEECGPYEADRRENTQAALTKFGNGDYTPEPSLRAEDGHREPLQARR